MDLLADARRSDCGVLSTQVLQEYFAATTRKLGTDSALARRKVELFAKFDVVQIETSTIMESIDLHRLHSLSFWDALIIRSAQKAHCVRLWTEDLEAGRRFGDVEVVNPFA